MPFVSILQGPPFEFRLSESRNGKELMVTTPFSGDLANSAIATIVSRLSLLSGALDYCWELTFCFRMVPIDRGDFEPWETQDREEAAEFIPADTRSRVMEIVAEGACMLVDCSEVECVVITTREKFDDSDRNKAPKWLAKYHLLISRLRTRGYYIARESRTESNQQKWLLTNR